MTTAIGFYIFLLTDFTGVAELGLISGTGMFISFVSTLTVLPALLAIGAPAPPVLHPPAPWLAHLEHLPLQYAAHVRVASAFVALVALALLPRVRYETNLLNLRDPAVESVRTFQDLLSTSETSPWTIDVIAADLRSADETASQIERLPVVKSARTLRAYVPADQDEKIEMLELAATLVTPFSDTIKTRPVEESRQALVRLAEEAARLKTSRDRVLAQSAARFENAIARFLDSSEKEEAVFSRLEANMIGSLPQQVRDLSALLAPTRVTIDDLPEELKAQMVSKCG